MGMRMAGFLRPPLAANLIPARGFQRRDEGSLNFSFDRHREMVTPQGTPEGD